MKLTGALLALAAICSAAFPMRNEVVEGNRSSSVRVVIYEDLQCGDCTRLRQLLDEKLVPKYGARVAFVYRDFPLAKHEWARAAAIAGRWVFEQDPAAGITFRREVMAEQDHMTQQSLKPWLLEFAARNNLDQRGILDSLTDSRLASLVEQDFQSGVARGVSRTPTVFVGNQSIVETVLYEDLARLIDAELPRAPR